ncbi:MAG: hypothetical protein GC181_07360 [Bacteroidetes bacterium]|nr:hypothetical protein [Bacteroidota bacterium]
MKWKITGWSLLCILPWCGIITWHDDFNNALLDNRYTNFRIKEFRSILDPKQKDLAEKASHYFVQVDPSIANSGDSIEFSIILKYLQSVFRDRRHSPHVAIIHNNQPNDTIWMNTSTVIHYSEKVTHVGFDSVIMEICNCGGMHGIIWNDTFRYEVLP